MTETEAPYPPGTAIPAYGLKVRLNHVYPEKRSPEFVPKFRQLWALLPLILRSVNFIL